MEVVERAPRRPVGKPFGTLVHELLSRAPFDAGTRTLVPLARTLVRMLGNTAEEERAAVEAAGRALSHPVLTRAAAADRMRLCRREVPILYQDPTGDLLEGIMDLAFRDEPDGGWTVVDFKTDVRPDVGQEEYRRQVALYVRALAEATGAPAEGVLLYV